LPELRRLLNALHDGGLSWRAIAALPEFEPLRAATPAAHVTLQRIARGHVPRADAIRDALGLPRLVMVQACPECGSVHLHAHGERVYDPSAQRVVRRRPRRYRDLFSMPVGELRWMVENRVEM